MPARSRIALATARGVTDEDVDLPDMIAALADRGLRAEAMPWDDPHCDWTQYDLVVVRSTWDYAERLDQFLAWADEIHLGSTLRNPAPLMRWNSDKRYLRELAAGGIPTPRTVVLEPGEEIVLPQVSDFVVKPVASAGARDTARYAQDQRPRARRHIETLHAAGSSVMVQPYLTRITEGERALVFLGGHFSHAVRKGPVLVDTGIIDNDRMPHPDLERHHVVDVERDLAERALGLLPVPVADLLYARVDLALDDEGEPLVMEVELIEPNLFLGWSDDGLSRFAEAVEKALDR